MKFKKIAVALTATALLASFAITGCGSSMNKDAVAATLDSKEISLGVANFMAQYQAVQMDSYFLSYYGEDMWNSDSGDGTTMTESVKKNIMDNLQEYYLMDAHASDYSVELTEEEKSAITQAASQFLSDNNTDALSLMTATQETVEEVLRLQKMQTKMRAAIVEEIDTNVTDEECAQKTFSYVRFDKANNADTSTDDTETSTDDADQDSKAEAEEFLKSISDDMEAVAESNEYTIMTCSYGEGDLKEDDNTTNMEVSVLEAADKLKDGEIADSVIESDSYYYVIRMDSTDDKEAAASKKESILSKRRTDKYAEVLENYKKDCKWEINESEWNKVNFDELYTIAQPETTTDDNTENESGTTTNNDAGNASSTATDEETGNASGTATDDGAGDETEDTAEDN